MTISQKNLIENDKPVQNNFIEKDATNVIKGVALIFMFIHHFFTFPQWYIDGISYPYLLEFAQWAQAPTKICVPIFAFLTGYFYYYTKNKTMRYSIKKSTDVWLNYLIVFAILLIPAVLLGVYDFSAKNLILELLGAKLPTMFFCWYVAFYIISMLVLPLYAKLSEKYPAFTFVLFTLLTVTIYIIMDMVLFGSAREFMQIIESLVWFPCIALGFIFAQYGIFYQFMNLINTKNRLLNTLIGFAFIIFALYSRVFCIDAMTLHRLIISEPVSAVFFIFGIMVIYHNTNHKAIYKPLSIIGKYSLTMWFVSCIFFNQCKAFTQPILYLPKDPLLVTVWGLLLCLFASVIIQIPTNLLVKLKNKVFKLY